MGISIDVIQGSACPFKVFASACSADEAPSLHCLHLDCSHWQCSIHNRYR